MRVVVPMSRDYPPTTEGRRAVAMPTLPLTTPVTVQLVITDGLATSCWQTTFTTATKSDTEHFKVKGP